LPTDLWLYLTIAFGTSTIALILALIVLFERSRSESRPPTAVATTSLPHMRIGEISRNILPRMRSVTQERVKEASERLRILNLEREILSYAIRRLYEAHAEGRITEEERDRLAERYKEELKQIREEITRSESIITLDELERMQEDLLKLFAERFDELNRKIEDLRAISNIRPLETLEPIEVEGPREQVEPAATPPSLQRVTPPSKPSTTRKRRRRETSREPAKTKTETKMTEADKRVEQLRAEIEKVLERLSRMEVED